MNTTTRIPIVLMSVEETALAGKHQRQDGTQPYSPRQTQSRKFRYAHDKNLFARPP